ncbi:MAG: GTP cyclohydrolase I [Polyangiaceae bacterium]|nr:GTP cyclohydrolase I [Polyangiaceae bacterium]
MMSVDRNAAALAIEAFLRAIGHDPEVLPELAGTGARVADAFADELCVGYRIDTQALVAASVIPAPSPGGLVVVRDIPVTTMCPHHLLPATGTATIAMLARDRIIGLGTFAALVDAHARRLTLQETIGEGVVRDLFDTLDPIWIGCRLVMAQACMIVRGKRAFGSRVETVALRSEIKDVATVHATLGVGR